MNLAEWTVSGWQDVGCDSVICLTHEPCGRDVAELTGDVTLAQIAIAVDGHTPAVCTAGRIEWSAGCPTCGSQGLWRMTLAAAHEAAYDHAKRTGHRTRVIRVGGRRHG